MAPVSCYTTRAALTEAGVPLPADWSASQINSLIRNVSRRCDTYTHQRFIAYEQTVRLSGRDEPYIHRSDLLPILFVSSLTVDLARTTYAHRPISGDLVVPWDAYQVTSQPVVWSADDFVLVGEDEGQARIIESMIGPFPGGNANVTVTGIFGWVDEQTQKSVATTTANDLLVTDDELELTSVAGLLPRDVLIVADQLSVVVRDVDVANDKVLIDSNEGRMVSTISSGATVKCYGAVPDDVEQAAILIAMRRAAIIAENKQGSVMDPALIRREETTHYEWEGWQGRESDGTGVLEADRLLSAYMQPGVAARRG